MTMVYGDFNDVRWFWAAKNKAKQSQLRLAPSTAGGFKTKLKKQTQFSIGQSALKSLFEKGL